MRKPYYWSARRAWFVKIEDESGKLRNHKLHTDEVEAFRLWREMTGETAAPETVSAAGLSVRDVMDYYIGHLEHRQESGTLAEKTVTRRLNDLASFYAQKSLEGLPVAHLRRYHATRWLESRTTWGDNTKHHAADWLRQCFEWAKKEGYIDDNPLAEFSHPPGMPRHFCTTESIYRQLAIGASDPKYNRRHVKAFRTVMIALRLSGCRPGEVADMTVERIDSERMQWRWTDHKTAKKTRKARVVPCCPCLWTLTRIFAGERESGPLFRPNYAERWTYDKMRRRFERLKKRVGVDPECVLYSFRHESITNALKSKVDIATVADMHGTSIVMIQRVYSHVIDDAGHLSSMAAQAARYRSGGS